MGDRVSGFTRRRRLANWAYRRRLSAAIILLLIGVALTYLGVGVYFAVSDTNWKRTDTYSMVSGLFFFVIGTGLAIAHEMRQEDEQEMLEVMALVQSDQAAIVDQLHTLLARLGVSEGDSQRRLDPLSLSSRTSRVAPSAADLIEERTPGLAELQALVSAGADVGVVREAFRKATVFLLGATERDLLYFTVEDEGGERRAFLPVFTRFALVTNAMLRNRGWRNMEVMAQDGELLLSETEDDVTVVINPWSAFEFQLPPPHHEASDPAPPPPPALDRSLS